MQSPVYHLHRIPEEVFLSNKTTNKVTSQDSHNCDGLNISSYNCECMGSSTCPVDELSGKIQIAAHCLFDAKGAQLPCSILPVDSQMNISGYDSELKIVVQPVVATNVTMTSIKSVDAQKLKMTNAYQYPPDGWQPCLHFSDITTFASPEPPDDDLMNLANDLMEDYTLDVNQPRNLRRWARVLQYSTEHLVWSRDVQHYPLLCEIVSLALQRCIDNGFPNILRICTRGDIRSMLGDVKEWLLK